jgi:hypothetical protein
MEMEMKEPLVQYIHITHELRLVQPNPSPRKKQKKKKRKKQKLIQILKNYEGNFVDILWGRVFEILEYLYENVQRFF